MIQISKLPPPFENAAGKIQNLLEQPCGGVSVIACLPGSQRSSHWHRSDWHYLYVFRGEMQYWERPVGSTDRPEYALIREGDMVYTGPNTEHWTRFPIGALLISMHSLSRTHEAHEADLVRVEWFE